MEIIEIISHYLIKNWIEIIGAVTGFVCVYLNVKENILAFPVAIITCAFYVIFYYYTKFYADMGLNVVFIMLSLAGWYQWLYGGENKTVLKISLASKKEIFILIVIGAAFTIIAYYYFSTYTDATFPLFDSFNTAFSLVAQYLANKKKLESWFFWILVDLIYVPMFFIRGNYPTASLYTLYLILATLGYFAWKKTLHNSQVENKNLSVV